MLRLRRRRRKEKGEERERTRGFGAKVTEIRFGVVGTRGRFADVFPDFIHFSPPEPKEPLVYQ